LSRIVWRIGTDTPSYSAIDLTGSGAKVFGGRWTPPGTALLYCADNIALACLETFVHFHTGGLPLNRYLVRIEIPDATWDAATRLTAHTAAIGWDAMPTGMASLDAGDAWAASASSALLVVPSVMVPEQVNILINPMHPEAKAITASKVRKWNYDPRSHLLLRFDGSMLRARTRYVNG
jgi:RES domain-containing protein